MPGTVASVIGDVRRHPPRGSSVFSTGYAGSPLAEQSITFGWPPVDDVLGDRHLAVSVSSSGSGAVTVFAQAESIWLSARPSSERFPAATDRIELHVTQRGRPAVTRTVTRAATVSRIVSLLNAVPIVQPDAYGCPSATAGRSFSYRLLGQSDRPLARLSYYLPRGASPTPCDGIGVVIDGRSQDMLLGGSLIGAVQRIFGIPTDG